MFETARVTGPPSTFEHREPFSHLNVPPPEEREARRIRFEQLGLRAFPPPFGHAVAVLSDIDDSDRTRL
jgi:hypothetical protein